MKKLIFSIILGLGINAAGFTQINKHSIGIFAGSGLSNTFSIFNNGIGYDFGLSYTYKLNKRIALISGLDYDIRSSYTSSKIKNSSGNIVTHKLKNNFGFISVPLLLNITIGNKVKYYVNSGLSLNYLLNYKQTTDIGDKTDVYYGKGYFNKFGIDLNIGIGVLFPLSEKIDISIEARFRKGLNNIVKNPTMGSSKETTKNALLLLGLKYNLFQ